MSIRIFNCAAMAPYVPRWRAGTPSLLVETDHGLVLVDTGMGVHDHTSPGPMVRAFSAWLNVTRDPEQTAVRQLARLGYHPEDVRHIVLTHLHFDHAGGLPDFPHAHVHVHRREYTALQRPRWGMALAYDLQDFAHSQCADALPTNAEFDLTPQWLNRLMIGPHVSHLRAFAAAHPDVRVLAGHMWQSFFTDPRAVATSVNPGV